MVCATNKGKGNDKSKSVYSSYGIALDGKGELNLGNNSTRNVMIFGVDDILASHTDSRKNNILVLGERGLLLMVLMVFMDFWY